MFKNFRRICCAALAVVAAIAISALVGCSGKKNPDQPITEGPETGVYYYDSNRDEYLLNLYGGDKFVLTMGASGSYGTYTADGGALTMTHNAGSQSSATYDNGVVTLEYGGASMRFLRRTPYSVSFDTDGGSSVAPVNVINGRTVKKPDDPVREGYTFISWYKDSALTQPFVFGSDVVTSDITLYAKWEKQASESGFIIDFDLNYPNAENPESVRTVNGKLVSAPTPERDGYTFLGWWISMYDDADKLSYKYDDGKIFNENTTLFALWQNNSAQGLTAPVVDISGTTIKWNAVSGAVRYSLSITGEGFEGVEVAATGATAYTFDFSEIPAGDYEVSVTAYASNSASSEPGVRYYKNKALPRVSFFQVISPSILLYTGVDGAQNYYITVVCGDSEHNHNMLNNGNSTNFNFSNCPMREGGIIFTVTAAADGYASSVSREFVYNRQLAAAEGYSVDEQEGKLSWNAVPDAAGYDVKVTCADGSEKSFETDKTHISLKEFPQGEITVSVKPVTKGYNSPEATSYNYVKKQLATPGDIKLDGSVLTWSQVDLATGYELRIGSTIVSCNDESCNLDEVQIDWAKGTDYKLSIRAVGEENSLWSDEVDMRYYAMYSSLNYSDSTVSWRWVIGADYYEIKVNDGETARAGEGVNSAAVKLDRAGLNTIYVRFVDGNGTPSEWATVEVYAYTVEFDSRAGEAVAPIYVAVGDKLNLPSSIRPGYDFCGWYNAPGGPESNAARIADGERFTGSGNTVLYAYWKNATFTLTLDYCDDREDGSAQVVYDKSYSLEAPLTEQPGLTFAGWYSLPDGEGVQYTDSRGASLAPWSVAGNVTVYARWGEALSFTKLESGGYSVTMGSEIGLIDTVDIPAEYEGEKVTVLDGYAFRNCRHIKVVNIPDSIELVETDTAFYGCSSLERVNVYEANLSNYTTYYSIDGVLFRKLGDAAVNPDVELAYFPEAKTGAYTVPDGVTDIPSRAFASRLITEITIPHGVLYIGANAFYNCYMLTKADIAFGATSDVPELEIESGAFSYCIRLESVNLPARFMFADEVTPSMVFEGCSSLENITIESGNFDYSTKDGCICNANGRILMYVPEGISGTFAVPFGVTQISERVLEGRKNISRVTIPNYVSSIGAYAFASGYIKEVIFEGGGGSAPLEIGEYAFSENHELDSVTFEDKSGAEIIGSHAFYNCSSVSQINLPASLKELRENAFGGCTSLGRIYFAADGEELTIGSAVFSGCPVTTIDLPANVVSIQTDSFSGCSSLITMRVDDNNEHFTAHDGVLYDKQVTSIYFYPANKTTFDLPDTVTRVVAGLFGGNTAITGITFGSSVSEIEANAFSGCTSLKTISFRESTSPAAELVIGNKAFYNCSSLKGDASGKLTLPSYVVMIGNQAFYGCYELSGELVLPEKLQAIGYQAFSGMNKGNNLSSLTVPANVTQIGYGAFAHSPLQQVNFTDGDIELTIASGTTSTYGAFYNTKLNSVTLPSRLTDLGAYAFAGSSSGSMLREVNFPEDGKLVQIGNGAFQNCINLASIKIPATVTSIGNTVFYGCSKLSGVEFAEGTKELTIEDATGDSSATFGNCVGLESITLPARLFKLGKYAFFGCTKLSQITFNTGANEARGLDIGDNAFENTIISAITLPSRTNNLTSASLDGATSLASVTIPEKSGNVYHTVGGIVYNSGKTTVVACPLAFSGALEIPSSITELQSGTFTGNKKITSVTFEPGGGDLIIASASSGSDGAFADTNITSITLPERLVSIGDYAFYGLSSLETINIPSNVTSIGNYAFSGCTAAAGLSLPEGLTSLGANAFENCTKLTSVTIPENIEEIPSSAFKGSGLTSIVIPATVKKINSGAFTNAESLGSVEFAAGADSLEIADGSGSAAGVFQGTNITSIQLPARLVKLGNYAFYRLTTLVSVEFAPESNLSKIGNSAFCGSSITDITLPGSLTSLGNAAFAGCESLETVVIEDGDDDLNFDRASYQSNGAFSGCTGLTSITLPERTASICDYAFYNCSLLGSVSFGASNQKLVRIPVSAFQGCAALEEITIPSNVTSIGNAAFYGAGLKSITIPASVQTIEGSYSSGGVFYNCSALTSVVFASGSPVSSLPSNCFYNCNLIETVVLPDGIENISGIATNAFSGAVVKTVTLPAKISDISGFDGLAGFANVENIEVPATNEKFKSEGGVLYNREGSVLVLWPHGRAVNEAGTVDIPATITEIGDSAFKNYKPENFATLTIPSTVKRIGVAAFAGCTTLVKIIFAEGTTELTIADGTSAALGAFSDCYKLNEIQFSERIKTTGAYSFSGCSALTSVTIPDSVETISKYTFNSTGLTQVNIPATVTFIGDKAFAIKALETLTFADGEADLEIEGSASNGAFTGSGIKEVVLPARLKTLGAGAFSYCDKLASVNFGEECALTEISDNAFKGCTLLKAIQLPTEITRIGEGAFLNSGLTAVDIPAAVTEIAKGAFYGSSLQSVNFADGEDALVLADGSSSSGAFGGINKLNSISLPARLTNIGKYTFYNCKSLAEVSFAPGSLLNTISDYAFYNSKIQALEVPDAVITIGTNAFSSCTQLASLTFGERSRLTTIANSAFTSCSMLTAVKIPASVTSIGTGAFNSCGNLSEITFAEGGVENLVLASGMGMFNYCTSLRTVKLPARLTEIGNYVFSGLTNLEEVSFEDGSRLVKIGSYAFDGCVLLSAFDVASSVTEIGESAFEGCEKLAEVNFAANCKLGSIPASAFSGCVELSAIDLPSSVTFIGESAFEGCAALVSATLPDSLSELGESAFKNCENLASVTVPGDLSDIPAHAFEGCVSLGDVLISYGVVSIGDYAFDGCVDASVNISSTVQRVQSYALRGVKAIQIATDNVDFVISDGVLYNRAKTTFVAAPTDLQSTVTIPETVDLIPGYAFAGCTSLTGINLPEKLVEIGEYAFKDCTSVSRIEIPAQVAVVKEHAFDGWASGQTIVVKGYTGESGLPAGWRLWRENCLADILFEG